MERCIVDRRKLAGCLDGWRSGRVGGGLRAILAGWSDRMIEGEKSRVVNWLVDWLFS